MSVDDFLDKKLGKKEKSGSGGSRGGGGTPRTRKPKVPENIKILFNSLDKSITSSWGPKHDGVIRWDAKYTMWLSFKEWFLELSKK